MPQNTNTQESILVEVPQEINYWFIRTDKGEFYDTFKENNFIGINWNSITKDDLDNLDTEALRSKIIRTEGLDSSKQSTKGKVTSIINKLKNFKELSKNDVVIIPNKGTRKVSFGIIVDEDIYNAVNEEFDCPHVKRRKVKWLASNDLDRLNPKFLKLKINQHSLSNIDDLKNDINSIIFKVYKSGEFSHIVFDVEQTEEIDTRILTGAMDNIQDLLVDINTRFGLNEPEIENSKIKLSIQSPGFFEIKAKASRTLTIFALLLGLSSCTPNSSEYNLTKNKLVEKGINTEQVNNFYTERKDTLDETKAQLDTMKVNHKKFNNITDGFE